MSKGVMERRYSKTHHKRREKILGIFGQEASPPMKMMGGNPRGIKRQINDKRETISKQGIIKHAGISVPKM